MSFKSVYPLKRVLCESNRHEVQGSATGALRRGCQTCKTSLASDFGDRCRDHRGSPRPAAPEERFGEDAKLILWLSGESLAGQPPNRNINSICFSFALITWRRLECAFQGHSGHFKACKPAAIQTPLLHACETERR